MRPVRIILGIKVHHIFFFVCVLYGLLSLAPSLKCVAFKNSPVGMSDEKHGEIVL